MKKIKNKKRFLIITLVAVAVIAVISTFAVIKINQNSDKSQTADGTEESINYDPPTEADKKYAEDNKKRIDDKQEQIKQQSSQQPNSTTKNSVKPIINFAEQNGSKFEVGSYVPSVFEDGGTCTLELLGRSKVTKQVAAVKEGSATYCPTFAVDMSELGSGTWKVTVSYQSAISSGTSDSQEVTLN